ncbi:ribosomal protein l37, mitochondrial [Niveomyces insectorum RCEF 264]|uniref:Large ribosomal subunit protein mL54 n=1 Tax=Niveomyces insectorum RCEF 264 TaxID=1081102 RepID=A0A168ADJ9_9HYPO|nr:ribosomal protein l37, mitochondrial [Niveomyces insectorum RCEF 264]
MHTCRALFRSAWTRSIPSAPARQCLRRSAYFSTTSPVRKAASTAPAASSPTPSPPPDQLAAETAGDDGTPHAEGTAEAELSSCPAGTVLTGLNYLKGQTDPVALRDDEYPPWLWNCLEVMKKATTDEEADAGDEFSKSKKQRRMAAKRQRDFEAKILASGDLTALAPKIPLQHQSINLPVVDAAGGGSALDLDNALLAAAKRKELRVAQRKERRAKIKESNYLRSM